MIGRTDPNRGYEDEEYVYSIGSDRISKELKKISERINEQTENLKLDYCFDIPKDPKYGFVVFAPAKVFVSVPKFPQP